MSTRRHIIAVPLIAMLLASGIVASAAAQDRIKAIATFSIIADLVKNVGGKRLDVTSLVGPNGDAHVYNPTPADAKKLAEAKFVFVNGFGYEGWIGRLIRASGTKASVITVSKGVTPRGHVGHGRGKVDPHAWQSVANVKFYVANIHDALIAADAAGKSDYEANTKAYLAKLDGLEAEIKSAVARISAERRRIVASHDAFGYFADAYGIEIFAPQGVSTETAPSARDVANLIMQIRTRKIAGVFMENITDPRLIERIAKETSAKVGGILYSDALTDEKGPAPTYIDLMRHNIKTLSIALGS